MAVMVMDKLVAMKIVAPISLARFFLSDYERCKQVKPMLSIRLLSPEAG